jgi:hypothetical protein
LVAISAETLNVAPSPKGKRMEAWSLTWRP